MNVGSYRTNAADDSRQRRRLPCFTISNLAAAAALGFLVGVAVASTVVWNRLADAYQASLRLEQEGEDTPAGRDLEDPATPTSGLSQ
jgi:hypothetical protein